MNPVSAESTPKVYSSPSSVPEKNWHKIYDLLPSYFNIRPVWDGSYIYYACFCHENGKDFWVVVEHMKFTNHSNAPIKIGELVYPTHWMEIFPPLT